MVKLFGWAFVRQKEHNKLQKALDELREANEKLKEELTGVRKEKVKLKSDLELENTYLYNDRQRIKTALTYILKYIVIESGSEVFVLRKYQNESVFAKRYKYDPSDPASRDFAIAQAQYLCDLLNEDLESVL